MAPTDAKLRFNLALCLQVCSLHHALKSIYPSALTPAPGGCPERPDVCAPGACTCDVRRPSSAVTSGSQTNLTPFPPTPSPPPQEWAVRVFKRKRPDGDPTKVRARPATRPAPSAAACSRGTDENRPSRWCRCSR